MDRKYRSVMGTDGDLAFDMGENTQPHTPRPNNPRTVSGGRHKW